MHLFIHNNLNLAPFRAEFRWAPYFVCDHAEISVQNSPDMKMIEQKQQWDSSEIFELWRDLQSSTPLHYHDSIVTSAFVPIRDAKKICWLYHINCRIYWTRPLFFLHRTNEKISQRHVSAKKKTKH